MLHLAIKAFAGAAAVPGHARRHRPQLLRSSPPATPWWRATGSAGGRQRAGSRTSTGPRGRQRAVAQPAADRHAAAGHRENRFDAAFGGARRSTRRKPAPGARVQFRDEASGTRRTQRPELWNLYNGSAPQGRAHPGVPAEQLDRVRHLGPTSAPRTSSCRASTSPTTGRCSSATACCWPSTSSCRRRRAGRNSTVRFRTVGDVTCTGCVESTRPPSTR